MMIEQKGNTVDEAIEMALKKLDLPREKVKIEVIAEGKKGVFGLGSQQAIVRVSATDEKEEKALTSGESVPAQTIPGKIVEEAPERIDEVPAIKFLKEIFNGFGIDAKFQVSTIEDSQVIDIITSESALLIGRGGKNLEALQYLANVVMNKNLEKRTRIVLDVEGYRSRRKEFLTSLAKKVASEVHKTGKSISLEPMNAYERRIVHLAIKEEPDMATESMGEGEERHVVIKMRKI